MKRNRVVIGITGLIGSGKSTVCDVLKKHGAVVLSADEKTEEAYTYAKEDIRQYVSSEVFDENDGIIRSRLAAVVFSDAEKLKKLNVILHPVIMQLLFNDVSRYKGLVFVEVPLLFEANLQKYFDIIWLVDSKEETSVERVIKRDKTDSERVKRRIATQLDSEIKKRQSHTIITNDGTLSELEEKVVAKLQELQKEYS